MKMLASALALAGTLIASQAQALTFDLGGYTGPITIKFQNWESFTGGLQQGSENFGILSVTSVQTPGGGTPLWQTGDGGAEISGIFRDITVTSITPVGTGVNVQSTSGFLDLYLNPFGSFAGAGGAAQGTGGYSGCIATLDCYTGISDAGGMLFLSLEFASGINPLNATTTVNGDFNLATLPASGNASSYLNVTGGAYASNFDTDSFATVFGTRDLFAQNDFCPNGQLTCTGGANIGDWQLISDDPVRAFFIPEPGTLMLLGLGLVGFAAMRRKARA